MSRKKTRTVTRRRGSAVLSLSLVSAAFVPASVVAIAMLVDSGGPAPAADAVVADTTMLVRDRTERAGASTLYGIQNGFGYPTDNLLHEIDPSNADLLSTVEVTVPGYEVLRSNGLAIDPTDGQMYAVVTAQQLQVNDAEHQASGSGSRPVPASASSMASRAPRSRTPL